MERRGEPRFHVQSPARVVVLSEPRAEMDARVANVSGAGLRLHTRTRIAPGAALRIDLEDCMLLGEVCYCRGGGEEYAVGVQLDQALGHVREVTRLGQMLLRESRTDVEPAHAAAGSSI